MQHDRGDVVVVDITNAEAVPDLPGGACVEIPCRIFRNRVEPIPVGPLPLSVRGSVQAVKNYEELTIEAAVTGSRETAIAALMAHPLVQSYAVARPFFERVLENEAEFMPQFFK